MANSDGNEPDNLRTKLLRGLKESTILSTAVWPFKIPENVINFMRSLTDDSDRDPALASAANPYEFSKRKFNKIWAGRDAYENNTSIPDSPVTKLTTVRGAITAYWTSEK